MERTRDGGACLLCGQPNDCAADAGTAHCWCFAEHVDGELVAWLAARGLDGTCLCRTCLVEGVRSPCLEICVLAPDGAACAGCRRTAEEIEAWPDMTPVERAGVHLRLRR